MNKDLSSSLAVAPEIVRGLVEEMRRHDIQWGSHSYSTAVQWLRQVEDARDKAAQTS